MAKVHYKIRRAVETDADPLTSLAMRSKAYWGYDDDFLKAFAPELIISAHYISSSPVFIAEREGKTAGFVGLSDPTKEPELIFLFVEPEEIGKGCGRILWQKALEEAKRLRWESFKVICDPHAESFYLRLGCSRIGQTSLAVTPDRTVPVLRMNLY